MKIKQFSKNQNIVVAQPDKGKGIVLLDKSHYIAGLSKIVADQEKFELITDDICRVSWLLEDRINSFLLKLKNLHHLSSVLYNQLHVSGSGPGTLYGLAKIHKTGFFEEKLYRPIFAAYKCASYKLSKFLVNILAPVAENRYTLKNSAQFRNDIEKFPVSGNLTMASFDIQNLYTNIPLGETIDICLATLGSTLGLPTDLFRKLLELSVFDTMFAFDGKFYRQRDGLGMGLPLSPTMANIFLCYHEDIWLQKCPSDFRPIFYRRYIDDTFALFENSSHIDKFLKYLNSRHPNMIFTGETESDGKLSFLDCTVQKCDMFSTSFYRKPTFTGLGLSFFSYCPVQFKFNSINTLIHRAHRVCSSFTAFNKELSFLADHFFMNGYPKKLYFNLVKKFIAKLSHPMPIVLTAAKMPVSFNALYGHSIRKTQN